MSDICDGLILRPAGLAVAGNLIFVGSELGQGHRAAGVEFLGADAYLGAEAELGAVCEGGGDVHIDAGGVDSAAEGVRSVVVFCDDAFAVAAAVAGDVFHGLFYT